MSYEYDKFDPSDRVVSQTVNRFKTTFGYLPQSTVMTVGGALQHRPSTPALERGSVQRWVDITYPGSASQTFNYNPFGRIIKEGDELGRVTRYDLDAMGNTIGMRTTVGAATSRQIDPVFGQVTSITGPEGETRRMRYDARGNLIEEIDELGFS